MVIGVAKSSRRTIAAGVTATLLAGTCLSSVAVAQTWTNGAGTTNWGTAANWTSATVPNASTAIAQFGAAGGTTVNGANIALDSIQFNAGAPTYTVSFTGGSLNGSGIVNNSGNPQNVTFAPASSSPGSVTTFTLNNRASLGNANVVVAGNAPFSYTLNTLNFQGNSTAGNANITVQSWGQVSFSDNATAGTATIALQDFTSQLVAQGQGVNLGASTITSAGTIIISPEVNSAQVRYIGRDTSTLCAYSTCVGGSMQLGGIEGSGSIQVDLTVGSNNASTTFSGSFNSFSLTKVGTGTLMLTNDSNSFYGPVTVLGGLLGFSSPGALGNQALIVLNGGGLQWGPGNTFDVSPQLAPLGANGGVFDTNGNNVTLAGAITGPGTLTKIGAGNLTLLGANKYTSGTIVLAGTLIGNSTSLQGNIINNAAVQFAQPSDGIYAGNMSGGGTLLVTGPGKLTTTGNIAIGTTTVQATKLVVNGTLSGTVVLQQGAALGGSGTVGHVTVIDGYITPGNSIGTLNIGGNLVKHRGHYHAELNAAGQSDRINVGGTATIHEGSVVVLPEPGIYANSTTYTIVSAAGGVSGAYTGIESDLAFLKPTLSYDPNNVYLTLALQGAAFSGFSGNTPNQRAVGSALDQSYASASGDYATVIGALAGLSTAQASPALSAISSQPWANFGTTNLAGSALFMNTLGQQMAMARGGQSSSGGQRQALAQACDDAACDAASPFSVWGSAVGGVGSVLGNVNASTLTYNLGGAAAGIDYRVTPNVLLGLGTSFASGTQWTDGFMGRGWSNAVSVAAYGSFTQWGFYADLLAGYAYANNQAQRQIVVPNLQPRQANGSTGANQFLGQAELGYQVAVYAPASATVTPFARLQVMSVNQAAFSEWGANSLSLNVAQQTTNALRSTLGADLGGAIGLANGRSFDMALRLGWLHEYADVARPITAAFAGAPGASFIVYGATPQRDAAVIGFQAGTGVSDNAQIYLRYDGDIGSGTDNHALSAGLRLRF